MTPSFSTAFVVPSRVRCIAVTGVSKGLPTTSTFSTIFSRETIFDDFLFRCLHTKPLLKSTQSIRQNIPLLQKRKILGMVDRKKTTGDGGSFKPVLLKNMLLTVDVDVCQIVDKSG